LLANKDIDAKEWERLQTLIYFEEQARRQGFQSIAGIDEAGRGPLAGPVVAAACVIPSDVFIPFVNDSKQLTKVKRRQIFEELKNDQRICYGIGIVDAAEIDRINIYQATIQAMLIAVDQLTISPDYLLVDGLALPHSHLSVLKIIKGDTLSQSIAAASILAKETRDLLMDEYDKQWPQYGFKQHKGYGTKKHLNALKECGPCPIHRRSFRGCD
jgi:ribonuclease HII